MTGPPEAGADPPHPLAPVEVRLRDLRPTERPIVIVARVVTAERREITRRADGGRRPVLSGLLSDGTATVRFTWWDPPREEIERGTILRAGPVQIREFRGRAEVSFNWRTRVAPASESDLPSLRAEDLPTSRVATLSDGDEGFRLEVRVAKVQPKQVSVGEERRLVFEGLLLDASGTIGFSAWSDFGLKEGEAVRIVGGYVRAFRGRAQVSLDERSHVERIDGRELPTLDDWHRAGPTPVGLVAAANGGEYVLLEGRVVGLSPPSGLVYRCPTCRRTVTKGLCRLHGSVTGEADLRARLVLDDGSGAATVNVGREDTERLWGRDLASCLDQLREQPDPTVLEEQLFEAVFGRRLRVAGRATADEFGVTLYPETVVEVTGDVASDPVDVVREVRGGGGE